MDSITNSSSNLLANLGDLSYSNLDRKSYSLDTIYILG
jgi:hypothetical protein